MATKSQLDAMYREFQKLKPIIKDRQTIPPKLPRMTSKAGGVKIVKAPADGIPARVGIDCGSATCDVLEFNVNDELVDSEKDITVWNMITVAVLTHGERLGIAAKEIGVDRWWAIVDDCKDTGGE
jgi:hypothetical protein